jgi:hypothetical protein
VGSGGVGIHRLSVDGLGVFVVQLHASGSKEFSNLSYERGVSYWLVEQKRKAPEDSPRHEHESCASSKRTHN